MRVGLTLGLGGSGGKRQLPAPGWEIIRRQALVAEEAGFDLCVVEDALVEAGAGTFGFWDSVATLAAVAATTTRIELAHSMMNPPIRSPGTIANAAVTLDEISGGRYTLGIGAGNAPEDYRAFGYAMDRRYSRAAETVEIVHQLLTRGRADFAGRFHQVSGVQEPRGPRPGGPPIVVGAIGPKMTRLAVRFADGWNAWSHEAQCADTFRPLVAELERACDELGRDPGSIARSVDASVDVRPLMGHEPTGITPYLIHGGANQMTEQILDFGAVGFDEIRCNIWPYPEPEDRPAAIAAMADVIALVHAQ